MSPHRPFDPRSCFALAMLVLMPIALLVSAQICRAEHAEDEETRRQTEESLAHIERAERLAKGKNYQQALAEYTYILRFYPRSIYASQARQEIERLTPKTRSKWLKRSKAVISPSRLSYMRTAETLNQGVLFFSAGTSILGEVQAGIYDWLQVGLTGTILTEAKVRILKESRFVPGLALGGISTAWDLTDGQIYAVIGKKIGRLYACAGGSYIARKPAGFAGAKVVLSDRSSIMLEYNQPVNLEDAFGLVRLTHNLNTGIIALRYIFPYNIGVESGIGVYTRYEYDYDWETYERLRERRAYEYFLRFQLFWSVQL